ncbi:MAG: hypothetical protein Q7T82_15715 [Armatimonadota bacterium]|nr:hypothetical protein [Armatimonadota bacterium]
MSIAARLRPLCLLPLVLTFVTLFAGPLRAISMDARVGFDGVVKGGAWTPIAVKLSNSGAESFEGTLRIFQMGYGSAAVVQCTAKVNLPPNSNKLYHVYAKLPQWGSGVLDVKLVGPRGPVKNKVLTPVIATPEDNLIVSVGPRSSKLNFLNGEPTVKAASAPAPGPHGAPSGKIMVGSIAPEELPDRVAGYDGVDALVLPEFNPSSASPKALKAMSMWVASGGLLIVPGGADYRRLRNDFFDEILPVKVTGAGSAALGPGVAAVTLSAVKPGIGTAVRGESFPIIATREYVAGTVVFLAFDTQAGGLAGWSGQTALWKSITAAPTRDPVLASSCLATDEYYQGPYQAQPRTKNLGTVVQQGQATKTPSFGLLAIFLLAYLVVLVPVNYTVLRVKRRLELAWVTVPAIALFFTFGAYVIGCSTKGNSLQVNQVRFIEAANDSRYARQITNASIFSPGRRSYCVEAAGPYDLCQVVQADRNERVPAANVEDKQCVIEDLAMAMWSNRLLESTGGVDLGGRLEADMHIRGVFITGAIRNNTRARLRDCSIYYSGNVYRLGRLDRGEVRRVDGHLTAVGNQYDEYGDMNKSLKNLVVELSGAYGRPVLVGYSDSDEKVFSPRDERDSGKSITCYAFRLEKGGKITLPTVSSSGSQQKQPSQRHELSPTSMTSNGTRINGHLPGQVEMLLQGNGSFTAQYVAPMHPNSRIELVRIKGRIISPKAGDKVKMEAMDIYSRSWISIPYGDGTSVPNPARYLFRGGGLMQVRVSVVSANPVKFRLGKMIVRVQQ